MLVGGQSLTAWVQHYQIQLPPFKGPYLTADDDFLATRADAALLPITTMRVTSGGVLVRDCRILLARRRADREYYPGAWDIIGGHCRECESPQAALAREMNEELGIEVLRALEFGVFSEPDPARYGPGKHHMFVATQWRGTPFNTCPEEHDEIRWFANRDLRNLLLASPAYVDLLQQIMVVGASEVQP